MKLTIKPGQVWITRAKKTRTPSRRVVGVASGRICYSSGGEVTRWCAAATFRAWVKRYAAKATRTRRERSLQLRGGAR